MENKFKKQKKFYQKFLIFNFKHPFSKLNRRSRSDMIKKPLITLLLMIMLGFCSISYSQQWVRTYSGNYKGDATSVINEAHAIALGGENTSFVTGFSTDSSGHTAMCTILYGSDGTQLWLKNYTDTGMIGGGDAKAYAITVDAAGEDAFITGYSTDSLGAAITTIKYARSSGQLMWISRYYDSTITDSKAYAISVDAAGDLIVSGYGKLSNTPDEEIIVIKYHPTSGDTVWVSKYHVHPVNVAKTLAVDKDNNIIVTGYVADDTLLTGSEDYITIKYSSSDGSVLWAKTYNGPGNSTDIAQAMAVDDSNNVYITGYSTGDGSGLDYCTIKYYPYGDTAWTARYNGTGNSDDIANKLVLAKGSVIVTGSSRSGMAAGTEDYVTINYDATTGNSIWVKRCNGTGNNTDIAYSVAYSPVTEAVYVTGTCAHGETESTEDMVTIAYSVDSTGAVQDSLAYNSPYNNQDVAYDVKVDSLNNVYVTGYTVTSGDRPSKVTQIVTMRYGASGKKQTKNNIPVAFKLYQNYPNPFNPSTTIKFDIGRASNVKIVIYDILGREVAMPVNSMYTPGNYEIRYNMQNLASGIYFYQLITDSFRDVKKMVLLK